MEKLFATARELASPQLWSAAVEMARNAEFQEISTVDADERMVRVVQRPRDPVITVTLSEKHESWQCDCSEEDDPCRHVVAVIIAARQGRIERGVVRKVGGTTGVVVHAFTREGALLRFARYISYGDRRVPVTSTVAKVVRDLKPGEPPVVVTREEEQVDHVLPSQKSGVFDPKTLGMLLSVLSRLPHVELDGELVGVSSQPLPFRLEVIDDEDGFLIRRTAEAASGEYFQNGAALVGGTLVAVADTGLSADEIRVFSTTGRHFSFEKRDELAGGVIPGLEAKVPVEVKTDRLPRGIRVPPRLVIETVSDDSQTHLTVIPHLVYGEPVIAEVYGERLKTRAAGVIPVRDRVEEARRVREMQARLFLKPNEARVLSGEAAVHFVRQLKGWSTSGGGTSVFTPARTLQPRLSGEGAQLDISFGPLDGAGRVSADEVMKAWRSGASFVQLEGGAWGALPKEWLTQHRDALARLLAARDEAGTLPARCLGDVTELCDSVGGECPPYFERLRQGLSHVGAIPDAQLPEGLRAELRHYQRIGYSWLSFLRDNKLNALLADDMGLGKTVQAICALKGRSLVVAPTSVLHSWQKQIAQFRPDLSIGVYHGATRKLDPNADVTITSYALLRIDCDKLTEELWHTIVLDESQTIKNPDSQVARAAYRLRGDFKMTLSGTPVENSLEDVWSQFHFLNPGLLGSQLEFQRAFADPINAGDKEKATALRKRISPFILRRLKRDVLKELPPKTEVVLECELSDSERAVYEAVLAGAREDVVRSLSEGAQIFSVLEVLLRLRQACCHVRLLPGIDVSQSSKVSLLVESLRRSREAGHRSLVFSQWTSLLDLIEPELKEAGLSFSRIDGSTSDRASVVEAFQAEDGPDVMLLSLKAGGVGLTLTAADHVYILDPWWNPAVEDQAADRAHRIGQENPVLVHRLVAVGTVEERVLELQARKRGLLDAAIGGEGAVSLSRDEILALLS